MNSKVPWLVVAAGLVWALLGGFGLGAARTEAIPRSRSRARPVLDACLVRFVHGVPHGPESAGITGRADLGGAGALSGEQLNQWHRDPRGLIQAPDPETHQRLYEKEMSLYRKFERVRERIVRRGEPVQLFDEYLLYWREHGGPELEAEVTRLIDREAPR